MDNCSVYFIALGVVVFSELMILLNVHRLVKPSEGDAVKQGGELKPGPSKVQFMRMALGASIVMIIAVFLFLLSQEGCLG
jgi:hypothetical protein